MGTKVEGVGAGVAQEADGPGPAPQPLTSAEQVDLNRVESYVTERIDDLHAFGPRLFDSITHDDVALREATDALDGLPKNEFNQALRDLDASGGLDKLIGRMNDEEKLHFLELLARHGAVETTRAGFQPGTYGAAPPTLYLPKHRADGTDDTRVPPSIRELANQATTRLLAQFDIDASVWAARTRTKVEAPAVGRDTQERARLHEGAFPSAKEVLANPLDAAQRFIGAIQHQTNLAERVDALREGDSVGLNGGALEAKLTKEDGGYDLELSAEGANERSLWESLEKASEGEGKSLVEADVSVEQGTTGRLAFRAKTPEEAKQLLRDLASLKSSDPDQRRRALADLKTHLAEAETGSTTKGGANVGLKHMASVEGSVKSSHSDAQEYEDGKVVAHLAREKTTISTESAAPGVKRSSTTEVEIESRRDLKTGKTTWKVTVEATDEDGRRGGRERLVYDVPASKVDDWRRAMNAGDARALARLRRETPPERSRTREYETGHSVGDYGNSIKHSYEVTDT